MNSYIVKEAQYEGTYRNPYRRGGRGMKWGPWKTRSKHNNLREALVAAMVPVGLAKRAVFHKGQRLSDGPRLISGLTVDQEIAQLKAIEEETAK